MSLHLLPTAFFFMDAVLACAQRSYFAAAAWIVCTSWGGLFGRLSATAEAQETLHVTPPRLPIKLLILP